MHKTNHATTLVERSKEYNQHLDKYGSEEETFYFCKAEDGSLTSFPLWFYIGDKRGGRPHLFRGQTQRYPSCIVSLTRNIHLKSPSVSDCSIKDQATIADRLARGRWFLDQLHHHPLFDYAEKKNIYIDKDALIQHYGIPSFGLDFSHSWDVACFFATCEYTKDGWKPKSEGTGVLYFLQPEIKICEPVTFMPFPRPFEQKALVVKLPINVSLEMFSGVRVRIADFQHDKVASEYFFNKFDGGRSLFPPDPLSEVTDMIMKSEEIPIQHLEWVLEKYSSIKDGFKKSDIKRIKSSIKRNCTTDRILSDEILRKHSQSISAQMKKISNFKMRVFHFQNA